SAEPPFSPARSRLGFRGIVVRQIGEPVEPAAPTVMRVASGGAEEDFLRRLAELTPIEPNLQQFFYTDIERMRMERIRPAAAPAPNVDDVGAVIWDPRTANRGPYTAFAGFMIVNDGHHKLL